MDRARRRDWLARLERWTELPLTALSLVLVPVLLAPYLMSMSSTTEDVLLAIDYLIWGVFAADLVAKTAIAPDRLTYLRRHWFDVLLVALPMLRPLRVARSARIVRAGVASGRLMVLSRRLLVTHGLHYVLLTVVLVVLVASALVTSAERHEPDATIRSLDDGLWWAVTTVTTVGYGDTYPRTAFGRGIAVVLMLLGIALFGVVSANLAALFVEHRDVAEGARHREIIERLDRLEDELRRRNE